MTHTKGWPAGHHRPSQRMQAAREHLEMRRQSLRVHASVGGCDLVYLEVGVFGGDKRIRIRSRALENAQALISVTERLIGVRL